MKTILLLLTLLLLTSCTRSETVTETPEKGPPVDTITVATSIRVPPELTEAVKTFNAEHSDVQITVEDYHTRHYTQNDPAFAQNRLALDISTGILEPDIVIESHHPVENATSYLIKNQLYTDLTPLLDEEIFSCVARSFDDNGKMWGITDSFYVNTVLVNSSTLEEGFLQNEELPPEEMAEFTERLLANGSWTVDEMLTYIASLPDDVEFMKKLTQSNAMNEYIYPTFIDTEKGECYFESDSFLSYLDYMMTLPRKLTSSNDPIFMDYRKGKVAAYRYDMNGIIAYSGMNAVFANTALPMGYPTLDGALAEIAYTYTYMITSFTDHPGEAWEFLKLLLTGDEEDVTAFPTLKSVFARQCEYAKTCAFGNDVVGGRSIFPIEEAAFIAEDQGYDTIVTYFTDEDAKALEAFLDTSVGSARAGVLHEDVSSILSEEVSAYLAGKSTAAECAGRIQSRVTLWLDERK